MRTLLVIVAGSIGIYALWVLFIFIYTSRLTEIKRSTWHWKIYAFVRTTFNGVCDPKNSCEYRKEFYFLPIVLALWVFIIFFAAVVSILKLFFDWMVMPIFMGQIPASKTWKNYFGSFPDSVPYRAVTSERHPVYASLTISLTLFLIEMYRLGVGSMGIIERTIFLGLLLFNIGVFAWYRPSIRKCLYATPCSELISPRCCEPRNSFLFA